MKHAEAEVETLKTGAESMADRMKRLPEGGGSDEKEQTTEVAPRSRPPRLARASSHAVIAEEDSDVSPGKRKCVPLRKVLPGDMSGPVIGSTPHGCS